MAFGSPPRLVLLLVLLGTAVAVVMLGLQLPAHPAG